MKKNLKFKDLKNVTALNPKTTATLKGGQGDDFIGIDEIDTNRDIIIEETETI